MKVHYGLSDFQSLNCAIVTSGTFDGVHIGHQKILKRLKEVAQETKGETVVITLHPHPKIVLSNGKTDLKLLVTLDEKIQLLAKQGIHHLVILEFTSDFAQMSPKDFVKGVYQKIGTKRLVIGYDHRFGKNREGGFDYLQMNASQFDFQVEEIPRHDIDSVGISSTKIRNALLAGDIQTANQYLGSPYTFSGEVIHGDKIGRTLGFPTANLKNSEEYKLIPSDGIYAVKIQHQTTKYKGMLYIGTRPTLEDNTRKIEVNIFDFNQDIYDEELKIEFIDKIRDDAHFASLDEMKEQLKQDGLQAKEILKS